MNKVVKLVTIGVVLTIMTTLSIANAAFASSGDDPGPGPVPDTGDNGYGPGSAPKILMTVFLTAQDGNRYLIKGG